MSELGKLVDAELSRMKSAASTSGATAKGSFGESAAYVICERLYQQRGGILYHSYTYPVDKDKCGNIKRKDGKLFVENLGSSTEIDILYVTENKIFCLEVKAYKSKKITLTDEAIDGVFKTDKSPVHQNEMHARHLYTQLYKVLPDGESRYIVPIVVFVDECVIEDKRSEWQLDYIPVTTLNGLKGLIESYDKPLNYRLDLRVLERVLTSICISSSKKLPCRIIGE